MAYASGKNAFGISDRSGRRYRLREMKTEWTGAKVGPDEFDPKHPQLFPPKAFPDPQALRDPRPDPTLSQVFVPVGNTVFPPVAAAGPMIGGVGQVTVNETQTSTSVTVSLTGIAGTSAVGSVTVSLIGEFTVTVASYLGANKYYIDGSRQATLTLSEGSTYRADQSDSSNSGHPLRFSTTSDGSHGGGSEYTTGVTTNGTPGNSGAYTQITVASGAPTLYYYCTNHSGMGGQANTP